jgi:hypothetical protein
MGACAKRAGEVSGPEWRERLKQQEGRLRKYIPTSRDEAMSKAVEMLNAVREKAYNAGVASHLSQRAEQGVSPLMDRSLPGIPGREVSISLPEPTKVATLLDMFLDPARVSAEDMKASLAKKLDEARINATRTTTNPGTLPSFYPSMAMAVPQQFASGYQTADKELDAEAARKLDEQVEAARLEFEKALSEEYSAGVPKTAGCVIDGLAQAHVKMADGELNQALGAYLALASLMGAGTHEFTRRWVEKRDPKRQEFNALREAVLRRMQARPSPIQVTPPTIEPEATSPDLAA